jgi:hypothetical protein
MGRARTVLFPRIYRDRNSGSDTTTRTCVAFVPLSDADQIFSHSSMISPSEQDIAHEAQA